MTLIKTAWPARMVGLSRFPFAKRGKPCVDQWTSSFPLIRIFYDAFTNEVGQLTLANFQEFFTDSSYLRSFWKSMVLGVAAVFTTSVIGIAVAFLLIRYDFPGRNLFSDLTMLPLILPPLVGVLGFVFIFGRAGTVNILLTDWLGMEQPINFMYGLHGVLLVETVHLFPMITLSVLGAVDQDIDAPEALERRIAHPLDARARFPGHIGNVYYMDEFVGEYRIRMTGVVCGLEPGRRIVWQLKKGVTLPVWLTLELKDDAAGVAITHTIEAGFRGLGRLFDPLLRLYFSDQFERAMDKHARVEFPKLRDLLRSADSGLLADEQSDGSRLAGSCSSPGKLR